MQATKYAIYQLTMDGKRKSRAQTTTKSLEEANKLKKAYEKGRGKKFEIVPINPLESATSPEEIVEPSIEFPVESIADTQLIVHTELEPVEVVEEGIKPQAFQHLEMSISVVLTTAEGSHVLIKYDPINLDAAVLNIDEKNGELLGNLPQTLGKIIKKAQAKKPNSGQALLTDAWKLIRAGKAKDIKGAMKILKKSKATQQKEN